MFHQVKAKKYLGQHFLKDDNIALKIVNSLSYKNNNVLEIGPGTGILTKYLLNVNGINIFVIEIDKESVEYLKNHFPKLKDKIISSDFLKYDLNKIFPDKFSIIGNLPYNISSQIFFKILDYRNKITKVICMLQKEVAERISSPCGSKKYGILSVLMQAYYDIKYLFTVNENSFYPQPKVKSAVLSLSRNNTLKLNCNEELFFRVVKTAFNQRRKTIRNALKNFNLNKNIILYELFDKRAEQLGVDEFVKITNYIEQNL